MLDLIIKNGDCFISGKLQKKDIGVLNGKMPENDRRLDFVRANLNYENGVLNVRPFNFQDSSMITNFSQADCLIVRNPFEKQISHGENVKVFKFPNNI